ncbi:MAG TPA: histidine triad nucleotide-binding protein [Candidatus Dormibacteraeota bacterium]
MPEDCLFCKIFAREIPAREVFRDDDVVAFDDIQPVAPTHVLVIPRQHIASVHDLVEEHHGLVSKLITVANKIADDRGVAQDGYRLVFNTGPQAGQSVYHVHLHLLGGRALGWPPG